MRRYKSCIQEAELLAMSPEAVAAFLEARARDARGDSYDDHVDEKAEESLRKRNIARIDLALARFGRHMKVVAELFNSSPPSNPVRLACLANTSLGLDDLNEFPVNLLGDESATAAWVIGRAARSRKPSPKVASDVELSALFENETLSDVFLLNVLERNEEWEALPDERLRFIVSRLQYSSRMRMPMEDERGGEKRSLYNAVFDAAWKLAMTVPVTPEWARVLFGLYENLVPWAPSIEEPLKVAARWHMDPAESSAGQVSSMISKTRQEFMRGIRTGLARLALSENSELLSELTGHPDVAFRRAAYASGSLSTEQLWGGFAVDGKAAFEEFIGNTSLWQRPEVRQAMWEMAQAVDEADLFGDAGAIANYQLMEKNRWKGRLTWFPDVDGGEISYLTKNNTPPDVGVRPRTADGIPRLEKKPECGGALTAAFKTLATSVGWMSWFALGAIAATLFNR